MVFQHCKIRHSQEATALTPKCCWQKWNPSPAGALDSAQSQACLNIPAGIRARRKESSSQTHWSSNFHACFGHCSAVVGFFFASELRRSPAICTSTEAVQNRQSELGQEIWGLMQGLGPSQNEVWLQCTPVRPFSNCSTTASNLLLPWLEF